MGFWKFFVGNSSSLGVSRLGLVFAAFLTVAFQRSDASAAPRTSGAVLPLASSRKFHCLINTPKANQLVTMRARASTGEVSFKRVRSSRVRASLKESGKRAALLKLSRALRECHSMKIPSTQTPTPAPTIPPPQSTPPFEETPQPTPSPTPQPTSSPPSEPPSELCSDRVDNDLDQAIDEEDSDCHENGATYYLSMSLGDDSWSGLIPIPNSEGTDGPKKSLSEAVRILRTIAEPGDQVLLRRGDIWTDHTASTPPLALSNVQGTFERIITLAAYGPGVQKPRIDVGGSTSQIVNLSNRSQHLLIRDLHLTSSAPLGSRPQGIQVLDCSGDEPPSHIVFDGLDITDLRYGVTLQGNHLTLRNSTIRNNFKNGPLEEGGHTQGLYVGKQCGGGTFIQVLHNHFENNGSKESWFDWNAYLSCSDCSFVGNYVTDGSSGLKVRNCSRIRVADNIFSDINSVGISVGGSGGLTSQDIVIERNLIRRTIDGITVVRQSIGAGIIRNLSLINNIFHDNLPRPSGGGDFPGYLMISTNDERSNVLIAHNTFHNVRHKAGIYINADAGEEAQTQTDVRLLNNLLEIKDDQMPALFMKGDASAIIRIDFNLYDAARKVRADGNQYFTSLSDARSIFPALELHGIEGHASLVPIVTSIGPLPMLTEGSAALDRGECLIGVRSDFFETNRPSEGCDIGAEESPVGILFDNEP